MVESLEVYGAIASIIGIPLAIYLYLKSRKNKPIQFRSLSPEKVIPESYIDWLIDRTNHMDIEGLTKDSQIINVTLPKIWRVLYSNDPDKKSEKDEKSSKLLDIEAIAGKGETLLVSGLAGSGKTTLNVEE